MSDDKEREIPGVEERSDVEEEGCESTPTFAQAAAFGDAVNDGKAWDDENIFLWEHGVAVEPWPEPVDGKELLDALQKLIALFVLLPKWAAETLALWVLHTYAFKLRQVATYIGVESPEKRCGKTTLLTVLCELVNRPVVASNISSPAFFRVIEEKEPTLLIDEGDTVLHRNRELRGILNSGYAKKTAYVIERQSVSGWRRGSVEGLKSKVQNPRQRRTEQKTGDGGGLKIEGGLQGCCGFRVGVQKR